MFANYFVTAVFVFGLFLNPKRPAVSFFLWIGTSLWWMLWNWKVGDYPQTIMFLVSVIACTIQFWRTA